MRNTKPFGALGAPTPRRSGDETPAMICRVVFEELCVLANGDIVCSCADPTGVRIYGNVLHDRIDDVFNGPMYREIREWQLKSQPDSWCPVIDANCAGRIARAGAGHGLDGRWVKLLQLEPASHCNLRCPACPVTTHFADEALSTRADQMLPLETMLDVIDQLPHLEILLFYNFGEPFLHKDAIPFLREVRRRRPDIFIAASTNALPLTSRKIDDLAREALVDKLVFAIDGFTEESYRKYRVGGQLARALRNMTAFVEATKSAGARSRIEIVWQYILFEWNDGDEELRAAHAFAREIGVEIDWKLTHTPGASQRFSLNSASFSALTNNQWTHHSATCEVQLKDFLAHGGVAEGRYLARLTPSRVSVVAVAGERIALDVVVENLAPAPWGTNSQRRLGPGDTGFLRVGALLRTPTGRRLQELGGGALPIQAGEPGGRGVAAVEIVAPLSPGDYELLFDVVEENVCWFFERGSPPGLCALKVLEGSAVPDRNLCAI